MQTLKNGLFVGKVLFTVILIVFIVFLGIIIFLFTDDKGQCLDLGGVWDNNLKKCRCDCLKWNEETGCIPLPDNYEFKKPGLCKKNN